MINFFIYTLLFLISFILSLFPRKIALYFGYLIGLIMYYCFPLRKNVAYKNLNIAFPNKSNKDINKIILKSYMHYGLLCIELLRQSILGVNSKNYFLRILLVKNGGRGVESTPAPSRVKQTLLSFFWNFFWKRYIFTRSIVSVRIFKSLG